MQEFNSSYWVGKMHEDMSSYTGYNSNHHNPKTHVCTHTILCVWLYCILYRHTLYLCVCVCISCASMYILYVCIMLDL